MTASDNVTRDFLGLPLMFLEMMVNILLGLIPEPTLKAVKSGLKLPQPQTPTQTAVVTVAADVMHLRA